MSVKTLTAAALLLAATATHATAQDAASGFYFTGAIGVSVAGDYETTRDVTFPSEATGDFTSSPLVRLGVGYAYSDNLRAELELSHRQLEYADFFTSAPTVRSGGDLGVTALMVNGIYAFTLPDSAYTLYAGAGLGMASVDVILQNTSVLTLFVDSTYTAPAGQLRFGAERAMSDTMTIFADYTYFHVIEREFDGANFRGPARQSFGPIQSHELAVGVRFTF